ncbi:MAG: hypothetical protein WBD99_04245 [Thermodesulfobacteriota bacterium]
MINIICKDVVENIVDYIEAELDDKTLQELKKHQYDCPECKAFVRTYRKMLQLTVKLKEMRLVTSETRETLKKWLKSNLNVS